MANVKSLKIGNTTYDVSDANVCPIYTSGLSGASLFSDSELTTQVTPTYLSTVVSQRPETRFFICAISDGAFVGSAPATVDVESGVISYYTSSGIWQYTWNDEESYYNSSLIDISDVLASFEYFIYDD